MTRRKHESDTAEIREALDRLVEKTADSELPPRKRRALETELRAVSASVGALLRQLDPIAAPAAVFDPASPTLVGRFVALALVAQPRHSLDAIPQFYGSGIYAFYYNGPFKPYGPISNTETPIYVGTAAPAVPNARDAFEQGPRLSERITYHSKNIAKATSTLTLNDFEFRSLVVQSGWERQAESYLIHLFKPIWNKEVRILSGFGKHGDSAAMRQHGRSPWDTLHPARQWAGGSKGDQKSSAQIQRELRAHFTQHTPYQEIDEVLRDFFDELSQFSS